MLPPIGSSRTCATFVRHVRRPVFHFQKQQTGIIDQTQSFASAASPTSTSTSSSSFSRHFYRNYRNDYFSNGAILNSLFRPYTENALYLPYSAHYFRYHNAWLYNDQRRMFSTSSTRRFAEKDETKSKVERTLALLKEELELRERESKEMQEVQQAASIMKKKSLWQKFIGECKHYYHGFKLLGMDFKISARLLWQVLRGHTLSRKERRQLIRSVSDLFRLVPFLIFVIVPFMEFTLPIFLKLFPNMLPSTFQEASKESEKVRKQLKVKLEMAKFLQATMEELSLERQKLKEGVGESKVKDFSTFIKRIREEPGGYVPNAELLKFSKLFEDELTLDNLSHAQLRALCRIVGLQPIGTSNMLRFQLYMKVRELKADDKLIAKEGVDTMSILELQQACRARGMRSVGLSEQRLKQQLGQWLELSLNEKVPPSLLLLSSTLYLPEEVSFSERLTTLMTTLPDHLADEVKLKLAELEGSKVDNKTRLEIIKSIETALKKEREEDERQREQDAEKEKVTAHGVEPLKQQEKLLDELIDKAPMIKDEAVVQAAVKKLEKKEAIDVKELEQLEELLSDTARGKLSEEKEDLQELKREVQEHKEDVSEVQALMVLKGEKMRETKAAKRLQSQVDRMISRADNLIGRLHEEKQHLTQELKETDQKEATKKDIVFINDMLLSLRQLQKLPDETKLQRVVDVLKALDEDHDGAIDVNLALKVIELLGQENVKLSHEQMARVSALLKKETLVDEMEQVQLHELLGPSSPRIASAQQQQQESGRKSSAPASDSANTTTTGLDNEKGEKRKERVAQ